MSGPCLHHRLVRSAVYDRCADCGDVLVIKECAISDCSHPIELIAGRPLPDRFPCPRCGEWVEVERLEVGKIG